MRQLPTSPHTPDLEQLRAWLKEMVAALKFVELVVAIVGLIGRMRDINIELVKRVAHLTRKRPRSETPERLEKQLVLPLEGLVVPTVKPVTPASSSSPAQTGKRRHGGGGRGAFPTHIPRVEMQNPVPPALRICPLCGAQMETVAHSVCELINVVPARIFIEHRLDETVACPNDDTIVSAPPPPAIVERGKLADTLIVEATSDKYIEHQPVERQCVRLARDGVDVAPQTLGRSVNAHIDLLMPVAELIATQTRAAGYLGTDATGIPVLDPDVTEGIRTGAMWCWTNACWVSFFYAPRGDAQSVRDFLGDDMARTVQCDGTSVTNCIERAGGKRPGCMGHGRRRFVEAARGGDLLALEGVRLIAPLFEIERASKLAGDTAAQRLARRVEHSRPIIDKLRGWLDEHRAETPPKTPLGRALGYLHRQWKRLTLFLEDGNIELTNNRRERELRRLVLGRKNWLFTWLDDGGERTAAILSIIASCIAHDVNPRAYLHLVTKLIVHGWPSSKLRELLPDRMLCSHPELYVGESSSLPAFSGPVALAG
ncbi:MAG: IS66 family transposase [Candidatus Brocadiae bacterium]|nr:IS66 family transposase [Candidatus Brocadiia bacterium]